MGTGSIADAACGSTVTNCYNIGNIISRGMASEDNIIQGKCVGGLVGVNSGNIINSYNVGTVSGNADTGRIFGCNVSGSMISYCYYLDNPRFNLHRDIDNRTYKEKVIRKKHNRNISKKASDFEKDRMPLCFMKHI